MSKHDFNQAYLVDKVADDVSLAVERHTEYLAHAVTDITAKDHTRTQRIRWVDGDREYFLRADPGETGNHDPPNIVVDSEGNRFVLVAKGWEPVSPDGGAAVCDLKENDKFLVTADADCEIQLSNALPGEAFTIRVEVSGAGRSITLSSQFTGTDQPTILQGNGDKTHLAGQVHETSPSITAIINLAKHY